MSSPSSASNNRTEFIYQRNNGSGNSLEASESPSCENLVVDGIFPDQNSMDCHEKCINSHNSSSTQEDESHPPFHLQLCEFHQRFVQRRSPRRCHHADNCWTKSDRTHNHDHAVNSSPQLDLTPASCRVNSYPERISKSLYQERLKHVTKCSTSSKEVEGVEIKRNTTRTPRSVYTKQPLDVHPQDVQCDVNEGCYKYSSRNAQNPHICFTPTSTDSGPDAYEQKTSKKFWESSATPLWNETAVEFSSSTFKKQKSFEQDDMEGTSEVTTHKTDANSNYTDCFPCITRDCSEKTAECKSNVSPETARCFTCTNESLLDSSIIDPNEVQLSLDLKQSVHLYKHSQPSPETEKSSGYHSEIPQRGFKCGKSLAGPGPNLESRILNNTQFSESAARSSSNASVTSEYSQNHRSNLMQQKILRHLNPLSSANDALSRITERSSEIRCTDGEFRKPHHVVKSTVSFKEDTPNRDSEQEINCPGSSPKQERPASSRSILRQNRAEQTNETCANPIRCSQLKQSPNLAYIRASRQCNSSCSPEYVCSTGKMSMKNIRNPPQTCPKPKLDDCTSRSSCGTERTNKDKRNILQNKVAARNNNSEPPCIGEQSNELNGRNCPIHSSQINSSTLLFRNLYQKSGCPCSQKQLSRCQTQTSQNVSNSSQNVSNRELRKNFRDVLIKAKSEYFQNKCLGQSIPNQQFLSTPKAFCSTDVQNLQPCPAKLSQFQITSPVACSDCICEQQPTEVPFQNISTRSNANLCSSEKARKDTSTCTEDCSSRSERWNHSCSCEADIDTKEEIGITVKFKKPFEVAHISYTRTIQPKSQESEKGACSEQCPATSTKQEQHKSSPKPNPSKGVLRSCRSICHLLNKSFTDGQDQERYQNDATLEKMSQYGASKLKDNEENISDKTRMFDEMSEPFYTVTQEPPIIETSNPILNATAGSNYNDITEDFSDDQAGEQPYQSFYINSEEELSFCEVSNCKATEASPSNTLLKGTKIEKQDNADISLRSHDTEEPISLSKRLSFHTCNDYNSIPSEGLGAATLEKISKIEKTREEIVDETPQMYADENVGTEHNETATSTTIKSPARRIYESCLQKCSKIGEKLQMFYEYRMPDTCEARRPCEFIKFGIAPLSEWQEVDPKYFCCGLHHKEDNMCIYVDLCKCTGAKKKVGSHTSLKHKTSHGNNTTRPNLAGTGIRPEEVDHLGSVSKESNNQSSIYRAVSKKTGNECENHKQSIPIKIKWAVAKISVFDDSSKTYELMQVEPIPRTSNSESVVIVVPENRN